MNRRGKTEKISVTIPRELAGEIRSIVAQGEVSSFFSEALEHYLAYRKQKAALEKSYGGWKDKNHPELRAAEDSTRYIINLRKADSKRLDKPGESLGE